MARIKQAGADFAFYLWHILTSQAMSPEVGTIWIAARRWRWWYKIKALVCVLLNRQPNRYQNIARLLYENDAGVVVAITNGGSGFNGEYTQHWRECLYVGEGIRGNWWYVVVQESD